MRYEPLINALKALESADFAMGDAWQQAHDLCQAHEGEPMHDWLHALIHRIEGDSSNASYWYRRACQTQAGSIGQDAALILAAAKVSD